MAINPRRRIIATAQDGDIHPDHLLLALHWLTAPYSAVMTPAALVGAGLAQGAHSTSPDAGRPYHSPWAAIEAKAPYDGMSDET